MKLAGKVHAHGSVHKDLQLHKRPKKFSVGKLLDERIAKIGRAEKYVDNNREMRA